MSFVYLILFLFYTLSKIGVVNNMFNGMDPNLNQHSYEQADNKPLVVGSVPTDPNAKLNPLALIGFIMTFFFGLVGAIFLGQRQGISAGTAAGDDGDLANGVLRGHEVRKHCVTSLMISC